MAQLSIRVGSPAVCSPVPCFTAIKYHRGSEKEGRVREGRGGEGGKSRNPGRESRSKKEITRRGTNGMGG